MGAWQVSDRYWALGPVPVSLVATVAAKQSWTTNLWVLMTLVFIGMFVPFLTVFVAFWAGRTRFPPQPTSVATALIVPVFVVGFLRNVQPMSPSALMGLAFASIGLAHLAGVLTEGRRLRFDSWCVAVGSGSAVWGIALSLDQAATSAVNVGFLYFVYGWLVTVAALARLEHRPTSRASAS